MNGRIAGEWCVRRLAGAEAHELMESARARALTRVISVDMHIVLRVEGSMSVWLPVHEFIRPELLKSRHHTKQTLDLTVLGAKETVEGA